MPTTVNESFTRREDAMEWKAFEAIWKDKRVVVNALDAENDGKHGVVTELGPYWTLWVRLDGDDEETEYFPAELDLEDTNHD